MNDHPKRNLRDVILGEQVTIYDFVNLYGCEIGDYSKVGTFVEIQKGAKIGRHVKISSHTFVCEGVTIEDDVFIGHNVSFINDKYPRSTIDGRLQTDADWACIPTLVKRGASIGTSATILCGVTIGEYAIVGAGSVVTKDVPAHTVVAGVPAQAVHRQEEAGTSDDRPSPDTGVPLVDLKIQYQSIKGEVQEAINWVLESSSYILGEEVASFESEFADYCGVRSGIAVNSGTSALHLALLAAGVGPGDEVITVPFTFVATAAAVLYTGARPVFVDIDPCSFNMDVNQVESAITPHTKAILPVHLYGQPVDMDPILEIARRRGLVVIEDAAQAHGAEYKGRRVGGLGDLGCFSFYPGKNLGAYGEGGIVVTNNPDYERTIRILRDWGQDGKYHHVLPGYNYRMDALQGTVLRVKLRHLEKWTEARRAHAARYHQLLDGSKIKLPIAESHNRHVYHVYAVRVASRDVMQRILQQKGIHTGIHYPVPVHLQPAYTDLGYKVGQFPHSEKAAREVLSLPLFPELTIKQQDIVINAVHEYELSFHTCLSPNLKYSNRTVGLYTEI
jgi:dTDP-4-amino-4,6-dideoxygalactose transaminase/acetyltransferase-like isoleucine patch superfamily enzyme